jgi:hypothetical protein
MDPLFDEKFAQAKAKALSKLVKRPEELVGRHENWALSSDSYRRWLYLTDFDRDETVEIPVPFLGDDVIDQVTWDGKEFEISGWGGAFRVNPIEDWSKSKPMEHNLKRLLPDLQLMGPQLIQYSQDRIQIRTQVKSLDAVELTTPTAVVLVLSGVNQFGVFDLDREFSPDQWYELASVNQGEASFRRFIWTAGTRLQMALVSEIQISWEDAEELDFDLDHLFSMMPWEEEGMNEHTIDLFVRTYAEHEGEEQLPELLESLESFLTENKNPYLILAQNFYDLEKPLTIQKRNWENLVVILLKSLRKAIF